MLLMSLTSAWAEESSDFGVVGDLTYSDEHFTISGGRVDDYGLYISDGDRISINSINGEKITKVQYEIGWGWEYAEYLRTTKGTIDFYNGIIDDVNATSLEIYSDYSGDDFQISWIKIFYETEGNEEKVEFVVDQYVQAETFNTTDCTGRNVSVSGTGQNFTIISNNGSGAEIRKVDLTFCSSVSGGISTGGGGAVDGSGTDWSINNFSSSSLSITTPEGVNRIKVYYVKRSEVTNEYLDCASDGRSESNFTMSGNNVDVTGTYRNGYAIQVNDGKNVTITSNNGMEISKVDLHFSYYYDNTPIKSTVGDVVKGQNKNWSVNNVNSTSLTISHPGKKVEDDDLVLIDNITVYYREKIIPTISVATNRTAPREYWATFYSDDGNYQAPDGTKVYIVNLNGTSITMTEIADGIVNSEQGVVLMSEIGDIVMTKTNNESSGDYSDNSLWGTPFEITNPGNAYVLNYKTTKGVGFYKLSSTGSIPANRAYLVYDNANGTAQAFFAFDSAATGIEINKADANENDQEVYDLQGRRVAKPANGLYIVNGKKVIMK